MPNVVTTFLYFLLSQSTRSRSQPPAFLTLAAANFGRHPPFPPIVGNRCHHPMLLYAATQAMPSLAALVAALIAATQPQPSPPLQQLPQILTRLLLPPAGSRCPSSATNSHRSQPSSLPHSRCHPSFAATTAIPSLPSSSPRQRTTLATLPSSPPFVAVQPTFTTALLSSSIATASHSSPPAAISVAALVARQPLARPSALFLAAPTRCLLRLTFSPTTDIFFLPNPS
ncbi:hypothetical protein GW17_00043876, partial [Ensete ventricosum]